MCLFVVSYRTDPEAPILVAANREEHYDRPGTPPEVRDGTPRVLCGLDRRAGGTWLGVNDRGLLVAVTNRRKTDPPAEPRSRGRLCRELLDCPSADEAAAVAIDELSRGRYAGANYVCLDARRGAVIHAGDRLEVLHLEPGLHVMTNGDLDDPHDPRVSLARRLIESHDTAAGFMTLGGEACRHAGIIVRFADRGTVSSDLIALTARPDRAIWRHAAGSPDLEPFLDRSPTIKKQRDLSV